MASFTQIQTRDLATIAPKVVPSGLAHLSVVLFTALVVWSVPYLVPGLEDFQPLTKEAGTSLWAFFHTDPAELMVAEANPETSYQASLQQREQGLLAFAKNPAGQKVPQSVNAPPTLKAQVGPLLARRPGALKIKIPKADYENLKVPIEDPGGVMRPFYEALARTARRQPGALTRISHWGDSAIATDKITAVTRVLMQKRFGDAGHGFILISPPTKWYSHAGVARRHEGWKHLRITHDNARDGRYGLGGVRAIGNTKSFASMATLKSRKVGRAVSRFEVYYLKGPRQGKLALRVDGKAPQIISARADTWQDAVHRIKVPDAPHRLSIKVRRGPVSVYGVVLERDVPGVVYDNLGLIGCFGRRMLNANPDHFKDQVSFRKPDLMVLMYGGNTLGLPHWRASRYKKSFTKVVQRFKEARPAASCLVLSPLDHGKRIKGKVGSLPRLREMVELQRRVALDQGCAFFSIFDAMGGEGTMGRWAKTRPRLVLHDFAHLTRHGSRILGALLYGALVDGLVKSLQQ